MSIWWRPNFDTFAVSQLRVVAELTEQYPYLPAHVTFPKECRKLYLITMPPRSWSHTGHTAALSVRDSLRPRQHEIARDPDLRVLR